MVESKFYATERGASSHLPRGCVNAVIFNGWCEEGENNSIKA